MRLQISRSSITTRLPAALLGDRLFATVSTGHLAVDVLNGIRAVLLTFLSVPLGLTNTDLSLVSTIYVSSAAIAQPLFGHLADRQGARWLVAGGVLWMGTFFSLALIVPGPFSLVLLVLASLGSGAFHPAGAMQASVRGQERYSGRETTSAAYFFLFGQMGAFFGPLLAGPLLNHYGTAGLLLLTIPVLLVGLNAARQDYGSLAVLPKVPATNRAAASRVFPRIRAGLVAFALVAAFQSWAQQNMFTFVPKYLSDLGFSPSVYGLAAALFMGGTALGNLFGGYLADRFGKRRVASLTLAAASLPLVMIPGTAWAGWLFLLLPLSGMLTGAVHSILVVLAQRRLPGGMALASGLILGYMFTSGAIGTLLTGYLADLHGTPVVFYLSALLVIAAAGLTRFIPKE
jgi:FSR family fosmidomycin resistance protein-like MFS transporter